MKMLALPFFIIICECKDNSGQTPCNNVTGALANDAFVSESFEYDAGGPQDFVSDAVVHLIDVIVIVLINGIIAVIGSIANVINIIVFCKQGLHDTVNISLLGLAVSDLSSLLALLWMSISYAPRFGYDETFFGTKDIQYITGGWPRVCFTRITCWITAFITFERCLAIALPLKVKDIITVKRAVAVIVSIFVAMIVCVSPVFYAIRISPVFFEELNETLLGNDRVENGPVIEYATYILNVASQFCSFAIVVICTIVLVQSLVSKSEWRRQTANVSRSGSGSQDVMSVRDKRVVKTVTFISCIFIVCYTTSVTNWIMMLCFPETYTTFGLYGNTFDTSWSICNMLEAINSSINIIIYIKMSSKYRAVFLGIFCTHGFQNIQAVKNGK